METVVAITPKQLMMFLENTKKPRQSGRKKMGKSWVQYENCIQNDINYPIIYVLWYEWNHSLNIPRSYCITYHPNDSYHHTTECGKYARLTKGMWKISTSYYNRKNVYVKSHVKGSIETICKVFNEELI